MPRSAVLTSFAAALALFPSIAEAGGDSVWGTRGSGLMQEREHAIEVDFDRGWATLRVQRTFHNGIDRHDEAVIMLEVPETAVATGLRSLGERNGKPYWFVADLLEAEQAAATYTELTGQGGYYPKDPALLSWRNPTLLALQVFPVAPDTDKTVDYTLSMPASYEDGRWVLRLPALGTPTMSATAVLEPAHSLDQLFVDGEVVARGHTLALDRELVVELAPRDPAAIQLELASVNTGADRELVHYQIILAQRMSELPERAKIVVLLDLSRSIDESTVEAQRRAALAYLAHFVDPALAAEVAVLGFNHRTHALTPGFVSAREAVERLEQAPLARRNGSEIGLALAEADALLSKTKKGPRRIVLLSDFETTARITPAQLERTVGHSKAVVHLGIVDGGSGPALERDDTHDWAPLAAATRGVMWSVSALDEPLAVPIGEDEIAVFEEWARPLRIDNFSVDFGLGEDVWTGEFPDVLREGEGITQIDLWDEAPARLRVAGLLWNEPIKQAVEPSRAAGDRWSALAFGHWIRDELSEPEMMTLAMRGGAVSPVTSYLAIEPGVRPSTEGILDSERGVFGDGTGEGTIGLGSTGLFGHGGGGPGIDPREFLEAELGFAWQRCGGEGIDATVTLETMTREILDAELSAAKSVDGARESCMLQLIWTLELPGEFGRRANWTITL